MRPLGSRICWPECRRRAPDAVGAAHRALFSWWRLPSGHLADLSQLAQPLQVRLGVSRTGAPMTTQVDAGQSVESHGAGHQVSQDRTWRPALSTSTRTAEERWIASQLCHEWSGGLPIDTYVNQHHASARSRSATRYTPLACGFVPSSSVVVAVLIIDASVEAKIKQKHNLTPTEVREAIVLAPNAQAVWDGDPKHGRRLVVSGTTYTGRPVIAYLVPLNENDPEEGTFKLKTALSEPTSGSTTGPIQA
jgi:hypothetical protein